MKSQRNLSIKHRVCISLTNAYRRKETKDATIASFGGLSESQIFENKNLTYWGKQAQTVWSTGYLG